MASSKERFADLGEAEIRKLLEDRDSVNTKKSTKGSKAIFEEYLREKKLHHPENSEELASVLKSFYAEVRKKDGSEYTKNSLCSLRFGLNRHFKSVFNYDIIKDKEFDEANSVYEAQCVYLKKRGLAKTEHKPPIADEDIKKLYESGVFNTDSPATLQNKVFFEILFFFCRRGRQNLRQLKKDDFAIKINALGQRCVVKKSDELTKNHRVNDAQAEEGGMMVANDSPYCPVYSFEKYLTHLNPFNEFLFQRPKRCSPSDGIIWFDNMVVGENTLGKKMKVLSKEAKLSVEYTNHSIRATTITILDRNGYEARHIMSVSGHKSESSLKSYTKTGELTKSRMAGCLSSAIDSSEHHIAETPSNAINPDMSALATVSENNDEVGPLLTSSQEELIMRDFSFQTTTQTSKQYNFYNCQVNFKA
jgi:site-specific recombinase XerD